MAQFKTLPFGIISLDKLKTYTQVSLAMTRVTLHPEAAVNFDTKAESVLTRFQPHAANPVGGDEFTPELSPALTIEEEDIIGSLRLQEMNPLTGLQRALLLQVGDSVTSIDSEGAQQLTDLADQVTRAVNPAGAVSADFVRESLVSWLEQRLSSSDTQRFTTAFLERAEAEVETCEVWIPISDLFLQEDVSIASVTLTTITPQLLDSWFAGWRRKLTESQLLALEEFAGGEKHKLQGLAAAKVTTVAEPSQALITAIDKTEIAVDLLRIFHPANLSPIAVCRCRPLGRELADDISAYIVRERGLVDYVSRTLAPVPLPWKLSRQKLSELRRVGLAALIELAAVDKPTDFQERLLASLRIYSRNNLTKDPIEKLVFILMALESLLIKNENEAIQQNVGERLSFVVGKSPEERKQLVTLVRRVYTLRSRYLHHGQSGADLESLFSFMMYAWVFFLQLIRRHRAFQTKVAFLDDLDTRKLT